MLDPNNSTRVLGRLIYGDEEHPLGPPREIMGNIGFTPQITVNSAGYALLVTDGGYQYRHDPNEAPGDRWRLALCDLDSNSAFDEDTAYALEWGPGGVAYALKGYRVGVPSRTGLAGNFLYKSTDNGATWTRTSDEQYSYTSANNRDGVIGRNCSNRIAIDPQNPDHLLIGFAGDYAERAGNSNPAAVRVADGLRWFTDGGATRATLIAGVPLPPLHRTNVQAASPFGSSAILVAFDPSAPVVNGRTNRAFCFSPGNDIYLIDNLGTTPTVTALNYPGAQAIPSLFVTNSGQLWVQPWQSASWNGTEWVYTAPTVGLDHCWSWTSGGGWLQRSHGAGVNMTHMALSDETPQRLVFATAEEGLTIRNLDFSLVWAFNGVSGRIRYVPSRTFIASVKNRFKGNDVGTYHWRNGRIWAAGGRGPFYYEIPAGSTPTSPNILWREFNDGVEMAVNARPGWFILGNNEDRGFTVSDDVSVTGAVRVGSGHRATARVHYSPSLAHATDIDQADDDPNYIVAAINDANSFGYTGPDGPYESTNGGENFFPMDQPQQSGFASGGIAVGRNRHVVVSPLANNWPEERIAEGQPWIFVELETANGTPLPVLSRVYSDRTGVSITQTHIGSGQVQVTIGNFTQNYRGGTYRDVGGVPTRTYLNGDPANGTLSFSRSVTGTTLILQEQKQYAIYYDDPGLAGGTVSYQVVNLTDGGSIVNAMESNANRYRHSVCIITTVNSSNAGGALSVPSQYGPGFGFFGFWTIKRNMVCSDPNTPGRFFIVNFGGPYVPRGLYARNPATGKWRLINPLNGIPPYSTGFSANICYDHIANNIYICYGKQGEEKVVDGVNTYAWKVDLDTGTHTELRVSASPNVAPLEPGCIDVGAPYRPGYPMTIWMTAGTGLAGDWRQYYSIDEGATFHVAGQTPDGTVMDKLRASKRTFGKLLLGAGGGGPRRAEWRHLA